MDIYEELKEFEGEKIREKLIDTFNFYDPAMNSPFLLGIHRKDIIAWLEKQGQVKESEIPQPIKETSKENDDSLTKKAWSEEDIRNIQDIDSILFYDKDLPEETCMRLRNWLKSLKPNKDMVEALRTEYEKGRADTIAEMKKDWSEEDETNLTNTIIMLKEGASHHFTNFSIIPCVDWLKQLKQRIGG